MTAFHFTRPGFTAVSISEEQLQSAIAGDHRDLYETKRARLNEDTARLNVAHCLAVAIWEAEAERIAAALEITADEYSRQARRGLVAEHLRKNADRYAARATTEPQKNCAAALYRQAARATRKD